MKLHRQLPRLIKLETRDVPAHFGVAWPSSSLTVSFVPDGTPVDGSPSSLYATFASQGWTQSGWQTEILRAAQAWLEPSGINVGVVGDSGAPMNAPGLPQGDPRFGDIRVFGRPLSDDVVAVTVPPGPAGGTQAGDIIINTNKTFVRGNVKDKFDLFTVMVQEFGHAIGVGNSTVATSPMFPQYQSAVPGLGAAEVGQVQALYGSRVGDPWETPTNSAVGMNVPASLLSGFHSTFGINGDLTTNADVDVFTFTVPTNSASSIGIRLATSGQSLLQGRFTVLGPDQNVALARESGSPLAGDIRGSLSNVAPGQTYSVRVERAAGANPFGVGRYRLEINFNPTSPQTSLSLVSGAFVADLGGNDSAATATVLAVSHNAARTAAAFESASDLDFYRVTVPAGSTGILTAGARAAQPSTGLRPTLLLLDAQHTQVPSQLVRAENGEFVLQAAVTPGAVYYVVAAADPVAPTTTGDYHLEIRTNVSAVPLSSFGQKTLSEGNNEYFSTLHVYRGALMHFALDANGPTAQNFGVRLFVYDVNLNRVLDVFVRAHQSASAVKFLEPGKYIIRVVGLTRFDGDALPETPFTLHGFNLSDPIGPGGDDPDAGNGYENEEEDDYPDPPDDGNEPEPDW